MKRPLLDVIFASDKRKNVLLLLQDAPQEMGSLLKSLKTTRQALLPQVRILEEHYLVDHYEDTYELTAIGKLIVDEMKPLMDTITVFDSNLDYWGTRKLDFLPPDLLESIAAIKKCQIINPPLTEMYEIHKTFQRDNKVPKSINVVTPFLYPNYQKSFSEMLDSYVDMYFIISKEVLDKIKTSHRSDFQEFLKSKYLHLFTYNRKLDFLFLVVDDFHLMMGLLKQNGDYDNRYFLCSSITAVDWGRILFEYCLKDSIPINEI
jgi:predicted transcriptional regulator